MNKLLNIIAVPLGFLALKSVSKRIVDNPDPAPLIPPTPKETPFYPDLILRSKDKPKDPDPLPLIFTAVDTGTGFQPTKDIVPLFAPFDVFKDMGFGTFEDVPRDLTFQPFDVLGGLDFGGLEKAWATIGKK
jgi:hypothetical protein